MTCAFFCTNGFSDFSLRLVSLQKDGLVHPQQQAKSAMTVPSQLAIGSSQFVTRRGRLVSETKTSELWNLN
jgi:hypothetical protein